MQLATLDIAGTPVPACLDETRYLPLPEALALDDLVGSAPLQAQLREHVAAAGPEAWRPLDGVSFLPPLLRPDKIVCIGLNYREHAKEGGHDEPQHPSVFLRTRQSVVGHGQPLIRPRVSERFDYEVELAVVIGKRARHVSEAEATDVIFGYSIFNDGSLRDYQRRTKQWTMGKNFHRSGSMGPAIVTADALPPAAEGLRVTCTLNGTVMQDASTDEMIFPVRRLIADLTEVMELLPGDIIATGTPSGVGFARTPPVWMKPGDVCDCTIERIGTLRNTIEDEAG